MIVVDTSALMAILLNEDTADACSLALEREDDILISAGTLAEALIVAATRGVGGQMRELVAGLGIRPVPVTGATARDVALVYARWGRGHHPAGLNFGDCFGYALAEQRGCPLLFVGNDFSRTSIASALA